MAWPSATTGATPRAGIAIQGITTIEWGTENFFGAYVVLRYNERQLVTNEKLTQGGGITSTRVQVVDGVALDFTVRDDSTMPVPAVGTQVTIVDMAGFLGAAGATFTGRVIESGWEAAPKQPGERTISMEKLTLVD